MEIKEEDYLEHYGILRRSGRYPWGSGDNVKTRGDVINGFLKYVGEMRAKGLSDTEIARGIGITTTELRAANSIAKTEKRQADIAMVFRLKDKGYSNVAIGKRMELPESTVRNYLKADAKEKADILQTTANMLQEQVDKKGIIDVGAGVESYIGVSPDKLNTALAVLREKGYEVHTVPVPQQGTGHETQTKVLVPPGTTQKDAWLKRGEIQQIAEFSSDGGRTFTNHDEYPPLPVDPKRVAVRYADEGGAEADGVIYVRPGVEDISLGNSRYAQVRVKVGDSHFLKGMAIYKEDLPEGVDLLFNTNKDDTGNKLDAMKKLSDDPLLPFESVVKKQFRNEGTPEAEVISAMNLVNKEGDWTGWKRNLSSQVLSKQSPTLAKKQLNATYESRQQEFEEIMALTNPVVREKLLHSFADGTDSASVHLRAAALERQNWNVILPVDTLSPEEIYAPNYRDGEKVALIRYPHGGTFEIPELTVNNRHKDSKRILGNARDAVGINYQVAERLSGADFDGDTVLVIPNNNRSIKHSPALKELKDFDPRRMYKLPDDAPKLSSDRKQQLMGDVSNLITDMTIKGASHNEIARAVKHSMVVIDAEKHHLNYKQSAIDNGIRQLKEQYQDGGASTIVSRAKSPIYVPDRKPRPQSQGGPIDKKTGKKVYVETGKTRIDRSTGKEAPKKIRVKKLAEADDAHSLSSGTPIEKLYADHSNRLKGLANRARKEAVNSPGVKVSPSAKKAYASELTSLNSKLALANRNKPLERQAQIIAGETVKARRKANPNLDGDTLKKVRFQALEDARTRTGAKKQQIEITPREWEAIQAGAVSTNKLKQILNNADLDKVRELATPRPDRLMTDTKTARAKQMLSRGYTRAEVADQLGVSISTLDVATSGAFEG